MASVFEGKGMGNYRSCLMKARRDGPVVPSSRIGKRVPKCDREEIAEKLRQAAKRNPELAFAALNATRFALGL